MRITMPPLAVPSSLVRIKPVNPTASWNIWACYEPVLSRGRLDHHQRLVRGAGELARHDLLQLDQLVHQIGFRVEPAGRVHEQHVHAARMSGLDGVEDDRGRVGAGSLADHLHARAPAPLLELLDGGCAERVRGRQHDAACPSP